MDAQRVKDIAFAFCRILDEANARLVNAALGKRALGASELSFVIKRGIITINGITFNCCSAAQQKTTGMHNEYYLE